jgi:hypothetical protein
MATERYDFLKYWRVIRKFYCLKYDLHLADLEMILFLYSEDYFSKDKFDEFKMVMPWDPLRFEKLRRRGFIEVFRKGVPGRKALYDLSYRAKHMVADIYRNMNGEPLPQWHYSNPALWTKKCYTTKVYSKAVINMNEELKKLKPRTAPANFKRRPQRPSPE